MRIEMGIFLLSMVLFSASGEAAPLSRDELIARLRIRADVLTVSSDGKTLVDGGHETRLLSGFTPEGKFTRDWSSQSADYGSFKLRHAWTISPTGAIQVKLEEFAEEEIDSTTGIPRQFKNPIGGETRDVVDFGAIVYAIKGVKGKRVVVRFVPEISAEAGVQTIGKMKIIGRGVSIYDAEGVLWASDLELGAEYTAISTHRGTLVLSYSPFRGGEAAGVANGKRMTLRMKEYPRVVVQSESDFVPEGMNARVFVRYIKERRTGNLNSVRQHEASDEKRILERLK